MAQDRGGRGSPELHEARWQAVLNTAQDAIITIDEHGIITLFNRAAERIFGYAAEEVLGKNVGLLMPSPYREEHNTYIENYRRTHQARAIGRIRFVEAQRKSGEIFPIELSVGEARVGSEALYTAIIRDISERVAAERRTATHFAVTRVLAQSPSIEEAVPRLLQVICEGLGLDLGEFWQIDSAANVLRWRRMWHVSSIDPSGFSHASASMELPISEGIYGRIWSSREPQWIRDVTTDLSLVRASTAQSLGLRCACGFPLWHDEEIIGVMVFFKREPREPDRQILMIFDAFGRQIGDFTARKHAEARLSEMQALAEQRRRLADIGAIATQIAHDVGNPLAAISMQAQLILRRTQRDSNQPVSSVLRPAEQIVAKVRELDILIRELLDFAREQRLALADITISRLLQEIADLWLPVASANSIVIHVKCEETVPVVRGDEEKLRRALENLLKNAVEAMQEGPGEVVLEAGIFLPGWVRVSVRDTGPGIPKDLEVFRLFETTKPHGTGLGLPIVKQIVEAHGGGIHFAPVEPHGTVFHIDLPIDGPTV